jgi:DNA replication protein DnaC
MALEKITTEKIQESIQGLAEKSDNSYAEQVRRAFERHLAEQEQNERKQAKLAEIKRLGGLRQYETFKAENFENKEVLGLLKNYPKENYFIWGQAGVGKTHLAVATIRQVKGAFLARVSDISREIRQDITAEREEQIIRKYSTTPLLLDDLGSEKMTEFLQNIFFEIIDKRWSNMVNGLIITSNIDLERLSSVIGNRTVSRIIGLVGRENIFELGGFDRRKR